MFIVDVCGWPANGTNATVSVTGISFNHTATYECNEGFNHTGGDLLVTCQAGGTWSGSPAVCSSEFL